MLYLRNQNILAVMISDPDGPLAVMLFAGYELTIITFMVAAHRAGRRLRDAMALPVYCCLHVVALVIAAVELIVAPSLWRKTDHGIARRNDNPESDN